MASISQYVLALDKSRSNLTSRVAKLVFWNIMMTSSNGNIFRVTGPLCGDFTGHWWIPHKGHWREALMFSLSCAWINAWVKNREAGDWRPHRAHYDVIVMWWMHSWRRRGLCVFSLRWNLYFDGLVQDCNNSSALALELFQFYEKNRFDITWFNWY